MSQSLLVGETQKQWGAGYDDVHMPGKHADRFSKEIDLCLVIPRGVTATGWWDASGYFKIVV